MPKQLVVRHHRPFRRWLLTGATLLVVVILVLAAFAFGEYRAGYDRVSAMQLQTRVDELQHQQAELQEQIVVLQRERAVDHTARAQVQTDLETSQSQLLALQEEVAFYKGIVSPAKGEEGIYVQSLKFIAGDPPGLYRYQLVLVQVRTRDLKVTGSLDIKIAGARHGEPQSFDVAQLAAKGNAPLNFGFQYFQNLAGGVVLPAGFVPDSVTVTVHENGHDPVQQNFAWQKVSGQEVANVQ
ncbi:MAG: DUF6776 family protein [Gammaproteobacteria bacterium]